MAHRQPKTKSLRTESPVAGKCLMVLDLPLTRGEPSPGRCLGHRGPFFPQCPNHRPHTQWHKLAQVAATRRRFEFAARVHREKLTPNVLINPAVALCQENCVTYPNFMAAALSFPRRFFFGHRLGARRACVLAPVSAFGSPPGKAPGSSSECNRAWKIPIPGQPGQSPPGGPRVQQTSLSASRPARLAAPCPTFSRQGARRWFGSVHTGTNRSAPSLQKSSSGWIRRPRGLPFPLGYDVALVPYYSDGRFWKLAV